MSEIRQELSDVKLSLFDGRTTYLNDYVRHRLSPRQSTKFVRSSVETDVLPPVKPHRFIDHETFHPRNPLVHIPFDLLQMPKPITQTNPHVRHERIDYSDVNKEKAIQTRPRVYMTPAVSMDDVVDKEMRELMLRRLYTSDWKEAAKEAALPSTTPSAPDHISTQDVKMRYQPDLYPPLPEGWREKGKQWDKDQVRMRVDPTRSFWLTKRPKVKCGACELNISSVPQETKEEIKRLIKEDNLRLPHDKCIPGYTGYVPNLAKNVPLAQEDVPVEHPMLTVNQAYTRRWKQDHLKALRAQQAATTAKAEAINRINQLRHHKDGCPITCHEKITQEDIDEDESRRRKEDDSKKVPEIVVTAVEEPKSEEQPPVPSVCDRYREEATPPKQEVKIESLEEYYKRLKYCEDLLQCGEIAKRQNDLKYDHNCCVDEDGIRCGPKVTEAF